MLLWQLGGGPPLHATAVTARTFVQLFVKRPQECHDFGTLLHMCIKTAAEMRRFKQNCISAALAPLTHEILELCNFGILKS